MYSDQSGYCFSFFIDFNNGDREGHLRTTDSLTDQSLLGYPVHMIYFNLDFNIKQKVLAK